MKTEKIDIKSTVLILSLCLIEILVVYFVFNYKTIFSQSRYIYQINVRGYEFDNKFDPSVYEYNVVVQQNVIEISCDTKEKINGCNVTLDLTDKETYIHKIELDKDRVYIINIKNETNNDIQTNSKFYIKSVNGNMTDWTNKDIELEVIMSDSGVYNYSFDGGKTWQESNKYAVKSNAKYQIIAKSANGELSSAKDVEVDRIDKQSPNVVLNKTKKAKDKVTIEVDANDELSGVDSFSFNGGEFTKNSSYEITKPGKYYVEVKDKAGNISDKSYIEILNTDFTKENKLKTYTATFNKNGATSIGSESLSCTVTGHATSCTVTAPSITRKGWKVVGWSTNKNATTAEVEQGKTITLTGNKTYYAITTKSSKTYTATFNKNGATSIGSESLSCTITGNATSCTVTAPTITRKGWTVSGWSTNSSAEVADIKQNQTITLKSDKTYYAITSKTITITFNSDTPSSPILTKTCTFYNKEYGCSITIPTKTPGYIVYAGFNGNTSAEGRVSYKLGSTYSFSYSEELKPYRIYLKYPTSLEYDFGPTTLIYEKNFSNVELTKGIVSTIHSRWPFLFKYDSYLMMVTDTKMSDLGHTNVLAFTYSNTGYTFINLDKMNRLHGASYLEETIVHELTHKLDYLCTKTDGSDKFSNSSSYKFYNLYNKYKSKSSNSRPLRDYSYSSELEFFADCMSYYYMNKYNGKSWGNASGSEISIAVEEFLRDVNSGKICK